MERDTHRHTEMSIINFKRSSLNTSNKRARQQTKTKVTSDLTKLTPGNLPIFWSCSLSYSYGYARKMAGTAENITSLQSSLEVSIVWSVLQPLLVQIKVKRRQHHCPIYQVVFPWIFDTSLRWNGCFGISISSCNLDRLFVQITANMRTIKLSLWTVTPFIPCVMTQYSKVALLYTCIRGGVWIHKYAVISKQQVAPDVQLNDTAAGSAELGKTQTDIGAVWKWPFTVYKHFLYQ